MKLPSLSPVLLGLGLSAALFMAAEDPAFARRRSHKRYPPVTHPVVLWSRTLSESTDLEQRKVAAFKLSQYTQPIFQEEVINTLMKCMKDPDTHIKVLCTKAMGRAGNQSKVNEIRKTLLDVYKNDATLRNTLVRTFITRKEGSRDVHDTLLESLKKSTDSEDQLVLLSYFELYGMASDAEAYIELYKQNSNVKIQRGAVKVLSEKAQGQEAVISLLAQCSESKDTPLALTCLSGLRQQAKNDSKSLTAVEKVIESSDPDVLLAALEVIQVLPSNPNPKISKRLVEIVNNNEDPELLDRAVHALGVCGDFSEPVVDALLALMSKKTDEGTRISTALVLGKQAVSFPAKAIEALEKCGKSGSSQPVRTACLLGMKELESKKVSVAVPSPSPNVRKTDSEAKPDVKEAKAEAKTEESDESEDAEKK